MNSLQQAVPDLGIVCSIVIRHYRSIPPSARAYYDVEDMVSDVVAHIVSKREQFDPAKAKATTWIWWCADRRCKDILRHFNQAAYTAEEVSLDNPTGIGDDPVRQDRNWFLRDPDSGKESHFFELRDKFERMLCLISERSVDLIYAIWFRGDRYRKPSLALLNEIAAAAEGVGITPGEIRTLLKCV